MVQQDQKVKEKEEEVDALRKKYNVVDTDPQATGPTGYLGPMDVIHYNQIRIDAESQFVREDKLVSELKKLSPEQLKQAIPTAAPDAILGQLLQDQLSTKSGSSP